MRFVISSYDNSHVSGINPSVFLYLPPTNSFRMENEPLLIWLGKRIRKKREREKQSLETLAALCDIDKANLSRIEAGKVNLTILTLNKIAQKLFGSLSGLFSEQD